MALDVISQSKSAYNQWCDKWRAHAIHHSKHAPFRPLSDFKFSGIGKALLLVGNGYSFEENIETIKKYQSNVDIMCCDKTLGTLLDNGITPTFCMVADAVVDYEKYMKPWENKLQNTILFSAVTANPKWTDNGNWKKMYFYCVEDAIQTEKEFTALSKCDNTIPAATNVGNSLLVMVTQSDNKGRKNYFGYDKIVLIGYDFCWRHNKNYYAFDHSAQGKRFYMTHVFARTRGGHHCYTSTNLLFSAQWLENYLNLFKLPVVLGSDSTILGAVPVKSLESQMQYKFDTVDSRKVINFAAERDALKRRISETEEKIRKISNKHWRSHLASI